MADGSVCALESLFVVGVVQVDGEIIGKPEYKSSQGITFSVILAYPVTATGKHVGRDCCRR